MGKIMSYSFKKTGYKWVVNGQGDVIHKDLRLTKGVFD